MNKIKLNNQRLIARCAYFLIVALLIGLGACKSSKKNKQSNSGNKTSTAKEKKKEKSTKAERADTEKVIKTARSYIGTSYRYGGTNRAGLDCSGLVQLSFKSIEVALPRNSEEQSKVGSPISIKDIKEGDLVFFTDKKGHKKITHVGLVTEVKDDDNIKFIHSTTKLGVVENNLKSEIYYPIFLKAMRVF